MVVFPRNPADTVQVRRVGRMLDERSTLSSSCDHFDNHQVTLLLHKSMCVCQRNRQMLAGHKDKAVCRWKLLSKPSLATSSSSRLRLAHEDGWREKHGIVIGTGAQYPGDYATWLARSKFCLVVPGDGWSARAEDAVLNGVVCRRGGRATRNWELALMALLCCGCRPAGVVVVLRATC
jgi:hypothetical protein